MVHANNDEMLTVNDWKSWIEHNLSPIVAGLRECVVFKEIFLAVGNESLAPWHVERFGARLVPCLKEVRRSSNRHLRHETENNTNLLDCDEGCNLL